PLEILEDIRIRKDILQWRDQLAKRSAKQADYAFSIFRRLVQFGVHNGEITQNHLSRPGRLYTGSPKTRPLQTP
ncbi:MAG: integrase, partial [Pseudomonadota bacterium]